MLVNTVSYRRGLVEVVAGIHPNLVNLEAWSISTGAQSPELGLVGELPEEAYEGNIEVELSPEEARVLAAALIEAADAAEREVT